MRNWFVVRRLMLLALVLGTGAILAGCASAPATPVPLTLGATEAAAGIHDGLRTAAPTGAGSAGSAPELASEVPPTWTPTPPATRTATPTSTLTPTPSPTPEPSVQLEAGQRHQFNGDYEQAVASYLGVLSDGPTEEQARQARYHLAETYSLMQEYVDAAAAWEDFFANHPDDARLPQATLMAARAYHAANECAQAITLYEAYLSVEDVLADVVHEWIGDCRALGSDLEGAKVAYQQALAATKDRGMEVSLRERIAGIHLAQADYDAALEEYAAILDMARIDSYRAKVEYLAAQALIAADRTAEAYARYRHVLDNYPDAEHAYLALVDLVEAGIEVDEYQRGLVDYYAGATYPDAYGAAIRAFDRYLASEPTENVDGALYYRAASLQALGQFDAALESFEALIVGYPESDLSAQAWMDKGATLAGMGDTDAAVRLYQDLAAFFPGDERAPRALRRAASLREDAGAFAEAAELYESVQVNFPGFEDADDALWRMGLSLYRIGDRDRASAAWQTLVEKYPDSPYYPKSLYWVGKLETQDGPEAGSESWDRLVAEMPDTYYALRVGQVRAGDSLTTTRLITGAVEPPVWDAVRAEAEILTWLRDWTDVPMDTVHLALPEAVTGRLDFRRANAFLASGFRRDALGAFDSVRASAWRNPVRLAQLTVFFADKQLYGLAARTASRLLALWPGGSASEAPVELQRLAYPLVYADLLSAEAAARDLDPLLLAALIRQESLFEPMAESYAGARGLGQVMPATGTGIANSLDMADFVLDDLYRPHVSISFAAFYLRAQLNRFDDLILVALAAYNGGPGNTLRWIESGGEDLDLFVELITATQSRLYLQRVYEQYLIYERLYRSSESVEQ